MSMSKTPPKCPPCERLRHAIIGTGCVSRSHIARVSQDPGAELVAVCDVKKTALRQTDEFCDQYHFPKAKHYHDFREMLEAEDIDIVHVCTPPHWHALMNVYAMDMGCDVWAEKPLTRTIAEGEKIIAAAKRNGSILRINTWLRFEGPFYGMKTTVEPIKRLVMSGALGWPLTVRVSRHTGFDWKASMWMGRPDASPEPVPDDIDYDMWLGPAPYKPYTSHRTSASFRGYWDYDGGGLADMGQHYLDPVQYLLDKDNTSPVEIEAIAPRQQHPDAIGIWGRVEMTYADGCKIILESCEWGDEETKGKPYIEGPDGKIFPNFQTQPTNLLKLLKTLPPPPPQLTDFNTAVRTRRKFALNECNGHRSNILVHLANIAIRLGRKLHFDPQTMRFVNDPEANRLADQPMRLPWRI